MKFIKDWCAVGLNWTRMISVHGLHLEILICINCMMPVTRVAWESCGYGTMEYEWRAIQSSCSLLVHPKSEPER